MKQELTLTLDLEQNSPIDTGIVKRYLQDAKIRYDSYPNTCNAWAVTHRQSREAVMSIRDTVSDFAPPADMYAAYYPPDYNRIQHWRDIQMAAHPGYDRQTVIHNIDTILSTHQGKVKVTDFETHLNAYNTGKVSFPRRDGSTVMLSMQYYPGLWGCEKKSIFRRPGCIAFEADPELILILLDLIPEIFGWSIIRVDDETCIVPDPDQRWQSIIGSIDFYYWHP